MQNVRKFAGRAVLSPFVPLFGSAPAPPICHSHSADSHRPNLYRFAVNRGWFAAGVSQCMQENRRLCACASASSINRAERMRPSRGFTRASGPEARNLGLVCRCRHVHSIALLCSRLQTDHHLLGTICRRNNAHGYCGGEGRKRGRREQTPLPLSAMLLSISLVENIDLPFCNC